MGVWGWGWEGWEGRRKELDLSLGGLVFGGGVELKYSFIGVGYFFFYGIFLGGFGVF